MAEDFENTNSGQGKTEFEGRDESVVRDVRPVEYKKPIFDEINLSIADPLYGKIKATENLANTVQNAIDPALKENLSEEWYNAYKKASSVASTINETNARIIDPTYGITKDIETSINKYQNAQQLAKQNEVTSINQVSCGQTIVIDGKTYEIGYIEENDGTKTTLYRVKNSASVYYAGSDGKLQQAYNYNSHDMVVGGTFKSPKFSGNNTWNTSENDKTLLTKYIDKSSDDATSETTESTIEDSAPEPGYITLPGGTRIPAKTNTNIEYSLNSDLIKRKRYYVKYERLDGNWSTYGPYDGTEARQLSIDTFNMTPGQGNGAYNSAKALQLLIGNIRYALEDALDLSNDAVLIKTENPQNPGYHIIRSIIDSLDEIVPSIYRNFAEKGYCKTIFYSNNKQKIENEKAKDLANQNKNYIIEKYRQENYDTPKVSISEEYISENLNSKYKAYLAGNEYTKSTASITSSLPRTKGEIHDEADLYVNFVNINVIIDDLEIIIRNFIIEANNTIEYQVNQINAITNFTSVAGKLTPESVNEPLVTLRGKIRSIRDKYKAWKALAKEENKSEVGNGGTPSNWPAASTGGSIGGSTGNTPITEAPTEIPAERPTVPVTTEPTVTEPVKEGGPLPSIPVNRNTNGNGNWNGNSERSYYWGENNSSSNNEIPTEVSTTITEPTFDIKEGNKFKLPTSTPINTTTTPTTTQKGGNSVIPVLAGLSAAAAAGIGAKAYMDRKKNSDNDEDEFKSEDWSTDSDINIEYQEPTNTQADTLDFDDTGDDYQYEEPEKYDAKTHQELENLQ